MVGAVQFTVIELAVVVVVTAVTAAGATEAVTVKAADGAEGSDVVPLPLGVTTKVYVTPFVSPDTVQLCAPVGAVVLLATVQVLVVALLAPLRLLTVEETTYVEATPSAVKATVAAPLPPQVTVGVARKVVPTMIEEDADDGFDGVELPAGETVNV